MSSSPTPASRGGAVGKSQWMTTEIAVAIRKASRKLRKPSQDRRYEPDEEDGREDEVADEIEDVERLHHVGEREKRPLQRLLPGDAEHLLDGLDPARVRECLRPVRLHRMARGLVRGERPEHDGDLRSRVTPRQNLPDVRHPSH